MEDPTIPESAMVIMAHPDDAEFTVAGTVALWARAGCRVTYVVCMLEPSLDLRRDLVRAIRQHKPEVVITWDPTRLFHGDEYINHPDHRAAAQAALDAVAPASGMGLLWPEAGPPHRVRQVYIHGNDGANTWIDITDTIEQKITALRQHASQMGDWDPTEMIEEWAAETGKEKGITYAESFRVITLEQPHGS
jgi:LmbE family N-acetylglucosaminyl deacetylase